MARPGGQDPGNGGGNDGANGEVSGGANAAPGAAPDAGRPPLPRFLLFYAALFAAFGTASPFLPFLLGEKGLSPSAIATVLAAGTAVRLLAGPLGGRLADRSGRAPLLLAGCAALAAIVGLLYAPARGLPLLLAVSLAHAALLAPLVPVADALALGASAGGRAFRYGSVRGAGSAAFIAGALLSGPLVDRHGPAVVVWLNAALLAVAALLAPRLPNRPAGPAPPAPDAAPATAPAAGGVAALLRRPAFARMLLVAALVGGSHAMHDAFAVIRWRAAGHSGTEAGILWALSVAAEVAVFVLVGPLILSRLGPARAMALAAAAGILRWGAVATTAAFPVMLLAEPLHGLTFALLHLACMEVIGRTVPPPLAATAQALYGTVAMGAGGAAATLAAGPLYGSLGPAAFWVMSALCAAAIPVAARLVVPGRNGG